jgi:hypothetical protein
MMSVPAYGFRVFLMVSLLVSAGVWGAPRDAHVRGFEEPPTDCRPHTRWWWGGNALRKEDIVYQLQQMKAQGLGGVEQLSTDTIYEKGNNEYLSPGYMELIVFAAEECKRQGLSFSLNFGGPGWIWAGDWVPKDKQSKVLLSSALDVEGPMSFSGVLSKKAVLNPRDLPRSVRDIGPDDRLVKAVAGRLVDGQLDPDSFVEVAVQSAEGQVRWEVPEGRWRLMGYWITQRGNSNAVDHMSPTAMQWYCDVLGGQLEAAFGGSMAGKVDTLFGDSFEVFIQRNGIYWTDGLFNRFEVDYGYDLVPWLPTIWYEIPTYSSRVRYDVNEFLNRMGMEAFFDTFLDWCEAHGVRGRIQPYGFATDVIEGAGRSHVPEMEITAGEKDAVPWFDTRIGPKKYVASGAHLYGRNIVTTEAYTYLHWQPYRATLEELKIAGDVFLRAGTNKFYNHGYIASPERDIVPSRGFFAGIRISDVNTWWPYYHHVSDYLGRASYLLRQGDFVADIAVYSPLANQWTKDALNARKWTRGFDWGGLGEIILANGYDFDLINDDILQNQTTSEGRYLHAGKMRYSILVLPNIEAMPLASLRQIDDFVRGGGVVIALETVPQAATGLRDWVKEDAEVKEIVAGLFNAPVGRDGTGAKDVGEGRSYQLKTVIHRGNQLDWRSAPLDPFLKVLGEHTQPDFAFDLVKHGLRRNDGLSFIHRRMPERDIYFVTNLQDRAVDVEAAFRVANKQPWEWNPYTGTARPLLEYRHEGETTRLPVRLAPFASMFYVFEKGIAQPHVVDSDGIEVLGVQADGVEVLAPRNGSHHIQWMTAEGLKRGNATTADLPAPFMVGGEWKVRLEGRDFETYDAVWKRLNDWTLLPRTQHFSGTGQYTLEFDLPPSYCAGDMRTKLDLADVGGVAEVTLNGKSAGTVWMRGQILDVTKLLQPGKNRLEVAVTNTLINRVSGLSSLPDVPEDLQAHFGQDPTRNDGHEFKRLVGFSPLSRSGLLGPVRIVPYKIITVSGAR